MRRPPSIQRTDTLFPYTARFRAVKVVCDSRGRALYFSRGSILGARYALSDGVQHLARGLPALHSMGLYAYRAGCLKQFPALPVGPLESFESLEQLRALENGYAIIVGVTDSPPTTGVDTQADLVRVRRLFTDRL